MDIYGRSKLNTSSDEELKENSCAKPRFDSESSTKIGLESDKTMLLELTDAESLGWGLAIGLGVATTFIVGLLN